MSNFPELTILADCPPDGLPVDEIEVRAGNLQPAPEVGRERVLARWQEYVDHARAHGKELFNGPITCLQRAIQAPPGISPRILLEIGDSDYRQFVVTVLRDRPWFEAHAPDAIREALGNSALLTRGDHALLGIRSPRVSAYPARAHLLGGVLESLDTPHFARGVQGILQHLRMELFEEAAVLPHELPGSPRLMAVVRDSFLTQPELIWQWETTADLHDLARRMNAHEHSAGQVIHRDSIPPALWQRLTPVARESWRRWHAAPH